MRNHEQVPAVVKMVPRVAGDVTVAAVLARQEVAGPGIMARGEEGVPDRAGELAGDEDPHREDA